MSKYMQIRIHLEPFYRPELKDHFPKLARALDEMGVEVDPRRKTLYHIVEDLERGLYLDVRPALKEIIRSHLSSHLTPLRNAIEGKLAAWKLEGLDELLYRLEDAFEDLERDLDT